MSSLGEPSCFDQHFNINNRKVLNAKEEICKAVAPMILPDAAKMLTVLSIDIVTAILSRNDRPDVRAAVASLHASLAVLQAIDGCLDG